MSNFSEIYSTLSALDLSKFVQKKMGLTFLPWANAWEILMKYYPSSTYTIHPSESFSDGSMEVWVEVTIEGHVRKMWLPVMDNRNNAVVCPNARQVSDARMRCLVKCLALFGLGLYIYQGEDLPRQEEKPVDMTAVNAAVSSILDYIHGEFSEEERLSSIKEIWQEMSEDEKKAAWVAKTKGGFFSMQEKEVIRAASTYGVA
jgi:hypothetical protein